MGRNLFNTYRTVDYIAEAIFRIITNNNYLAHINPLVSWLEKLKFCNTYNYYTTIYLYKNFYTIILADLLNTMRYHQTKFFLVFRDLKESSINYTGPPTMGTQSSIFENTISHS